MITAPLPPLEPFAPREPPWGCDDPFRVREGVRVFRSFVLEVADGHDLGVGRECNVGTPSHHHQGAAWDWGPPSLEAGHRLIALLEANECEALRRFQIQYVIFDRRMWRSYGPQARQWLLYSGESAHREHVHFSFTKAGRDGKCSGPAWAILYTLNHPEIRP